VFKAQFYKGLNGSAISTAYFFV